MNSNVIKYIYFPYWKSLQFLDFNCTEFHNNWSFCIFLTFILHSSTYIYIFLKKMIQENFYLFYRVQLLILLLFVYIYFFHPQNKLKSIQYSQYSPVGHLTKSTKQSLMLYSGISWNTCRFMGREV